MNGLFPLCLQQQSRWRVLLLRAWCFHGRWDGRWRTQKIGRRRRWCLPQTLCPWVLTPVMGEFGVIVEGGCHFFFSDQGPLLKGGGDVGGECPCVRVFDFFVRFAQAWSAVLPELVQCWTLLWATFFFNCFSQESLETCMSKAGCTLALSLENVHTL